MISVLAMAGLLLAQGQALAVCDGFDLSVTQQSGFTYDAANVSDTILGLQIRATQSDLPSSCDQLVILLDIVDGTAVDPDLAGITGRLQTDWEDVAEIARTGSIWSLRRSAVRQLVNGETLTLPFYRIGAGQFVAPEAYGHTLHVQTGDRETTLPLTIQALPTLRFEGTSTSGSRAIDLGDIAAGAQARSDFFFRTNSAISVTVRSDNQGALVHERGAAFGRVAYAARVSGSPVDLTLAAGDIVDFPYRSSAVQSGSLEIDVPPAEQHYAGRYFDVITLSFIPY